MFLDLSSNNGMNFVHILIVLATEKLNFLVSHCSVVYLGERCSPWASGFTDLSISIEIHKGPYRPLQKDYNTSTR